MLHNIKLIYKKEMTEILRDHRTIKRLIVGALLFPVLIQFIILIASDSAGGPIAYGIIGGDNIPEIRQSFKSSDNYIYVDIKDKSEALDAIRDQRISFALIVPDESRILMSLGAKVKVEFYYHGASPEDPLKAQVISKITEAGNQIRDRRLNAIGVKDPESRDILLNPIKVDENNSASIREIIGGALGGLLPYLFFLTCLAGCGFSAMDIGAGEKERGTLETLLLLPVPRKDIIVGKFLVVLTTGTVFPLINISAMVIWLSVVRNLPDVIYEALSGVSTFDYILIAIMLVPVAGIFASIMLAISVSAKSSKEAAGTAQILGAFSILPIIIAILPGVELNLIWAFVPIVNVALACKEIIKGTMDPMWMSIILASSVLVAAALLAICTREFEKESVIFRE